MAIQQAGTGELKLPIRDLTVAYVAARSHRIGFHARQRQDSAPLRPELQVGQSGAGVELVDLSAADETSWTRAAEDTRQKLSAIRDALAGLSKAHQRRQLKVFEEEGSEVDTASHKLTMALRAGEQAVAGLSHSTTQMSAQEREVRQNLQRAFAAQLQQLSQRARQVQREHLAVMKRRQGSADANDDETANAISLDQKSINIGMHQLEVIEINDLEAATIDDRCKEIQRLATSVNDLHGIYKDVAALVIDQGTVLDRIDYNIEQIVTNSKQARIHIERADKEQRKNKSIKCIMWLTLVDLILAFIVIIKYSRR